MIAVIGTIAAAVLPRLMSLGQTTAAAMSGIGTIAAAAFAAIPGVIHGLAVVLKEIGANPLLSLMFCAAVFGGIGTMYGISRDAPAREAAERRAITAANLRADAAIAKVRADYERQLAALRKQVGSAQRKR